MSFVLTPLQRQLEKSQGQSRHSSAQNRRTSIAKLFKSQAGQPIPASFDRRKSWEQSYHQGDLWESRAGYAVTCSIVLIRWNEVIRTPRDWLSARKPDRDTFQNLRSAELKPTMCRSTFWFCEAWRKEFGQHILHREREREEDWFLQLDNTIIL